MKGSKNEKTLVSFAMIALVTMAGCTSNDEASISVITREDGSGTRGAFVEITGILDTKIGTSS